MSQPTTHPEADDRSPRRVLYCHCAFSRVVDEDVKAEVLTGLAESGVAFDAVPDLCELAARRDPCLGRLAVDGDLDLVACYPRAVRWLFHAADQPLPDDGIRIHNMREDEASVILERVFDPSTTATELQEGAA